MKSYFTTFLLMGLFTLLFGCKNQEISKESLYGNWEAIKLNDEPINKHGFTSIKMNISPDSIHITTQTKTFGEITTESEGTWQLTGNVFKSKIGEINKETHLRVKGSNILFTPDPLFRNETVSTSEYRKMQ